MRVLLVVGEAAGGIGAHVDSLARDLPGLGHEVGVFTTAGTAARFGLGRPAARVMVAWPSPVVLRRMVKQADVVHAHGHQAGLLAVLAAAGTGVPVVVTWHNAVLGSGARRRVLELAERLQARRATLLTGASDDLVTRAKNLGAHAPELTEVAAPGVGAGDEQRGEGVSETELASSLLILGVMRVAPQKRLDVLVDAAARLHETRPEVRWIVAGRGDQELLKRLEEQTRRLRAPVEFLGPRDDVPALMEQADIFVLTSEWEARALVVQEAMASGLPVVATDVGGIPGLLNGAGVLVPPGDPEMLAKKIDDLIEHPEKRAELAERGRNRYEELPTEADVVTAWATRYARLTRKE